MSRLGRNFRWNDVKPILEQHGVTFKKCEDGYICKRTLDGVQLQPVIIPGNHGKNFKIKLPYINNLIRNLKISREAFGG